MNNTTPGNRITVYVGDRRIFVGDLPESSRIEITRADRRGDPFPLRASSRAVSRHPHTPQRKEQP